MEDTANAPLAKLSLASHMLAEAKSLDEIKQVRDIAEAARTYAQAAKLGLEAQNNAAEIKLRAERKAGELLRQLERGQGEGNQYSASFHDGTKQFSEYRQVLTDNAIAPTTAHRWQRVAEIPETVFSDFVIETKAAGKELTTSAALQIANHQHQPEQDSNGNEEEMRRDWQRVHFRSDDDRWELMEDERPEAEQGSAVYQPMAATVYSHRSVEYYTPVEILDAARKVLGTIDLDPASCLDAQKNVNAGHFYTQDDDGLSLPWHGRVWLNPPYGKTNGRSNQDIWAQRLVDEYAAGRVTSAILLVKAALGYKWFEELFREWPVCFARSRLSFILENGDDDGQSKQGTALFYFGPDLPRFARIFREIGRVIPPEDELDAALFGQ